jgi:hypothetical protein
LFTVSPDPGFWPLLRDAVFALTHFMLLVVCSSHKQSFETEYMADTRTISHGTQNVGYSLTSSQLLYQESAGIRLASQDILHVRFEVFTVVITNNAVSWVKTTSSYLTGDVLRIRYRVQPVNAM